MTRIPMRGPRLEGVAYEGFVPDGSTYGRPVWRFEGYELLPVARIVPREAGEDPAAVCTIPPRIRLEADTCEALRALVETWTDGKEAGA